MFDNSSIVDEDQTIGREWECHIDREISIDRWREVQLNDWMKISRSISTDYLVQSIDNMKNSSNNSYRDLSKSIQVDKWIEMFSNHRIIHFHSVEIRMSIPCKALEQSFSTHWSSLPLLRTYV